MKVQWQVILARASELPEDKVGLLPRTISGYLDRFQLICQFAQSESKRRFVTRLRNTAQEECHSRSPRESLTRVGNPILSSSENNGLGSNSSTFIMTPWS
ncbi:hypothetical protein SAMN05421688_3338 [Poseidonocella pacifica]|uniref:Uncharacterized protein n=1 Tax=Poseidonocella pacifica TaxID=871651 RepID=A0A1I0YSD2_9RHOB|nr:hypothetical protein SAMN05421688_3338 [Poseidonocella pacifica]